MFKMDFDFVFFLTIFFLFGGALSSNRLIVNTTSGPIRGILNNWEGIQYESYLGIPYAESPTGALRFRPPIPKKPWTEILNATREGFVCPQGPEKYKREKMNENCLNINIHVPIIEKEKSLPILVFIHGGAFRMLSGNSDLYGPQLLLQHEVIFITMNYRLGALGHLSLNIEEASGNASLKDVLLSLKWIKKNIKRFGGDPDKITIGGQSSGAAMVHYLLLTEKSAGLFKQAILISGNAVCHRFVSRHPKDNALNLARELGLETNDSQAIIKGLREVDAFDIIDAEINMAKHEDPILRQFSAFVPSVEVKSPHAVITSDPVLLNKSGLKQNVPILAGFNYNEGIYVIPRIQKGKRRLKENLELAIPSDIEYPLGSNTSKALAKSIGLRYFDSDLSNFTLSNIVDLASDSQYIYRTNYWINTHIEKCNSSALYYYVFDFDGELNWAKLSNDIDFPGTAHSDELGYIFVTNRTETLLGNAHFKSHLVVDIFSNLLTNFVKYGNPTPDHYTCKFKWSDFAKNKTMLFINDNPNEGFLTNPLKERLIFWRDVFDRYCRYVKNGGELEKKLIP